MDNSEFIDSVARRLQTSAEQATAITRATLTTLAERIEGGEARDLSALLPDELRAYAFAPSEKAERFGRETFIQQVSGRAEVDGSLAEAGMRAVFDTLREAIPPGDYDDVVTHLPAEFWELTDSAGRYDRQRSRG
ncbi:Uncharacterized conserved protein, DUF2267 family [Micromonospora rhizosphaerae]|uniref:Uncharacterized conserved protein, DUF2267 family n=1 Tax=Micromonospora rhizosphaerae TaxID=568872 RepID=A0A1C6STS4_9ACTN|nr:DUF2267 domain-containing protein [Micromonospora rhizosphaerae]SCL32931.1 Uncharacterized conserved protein, DUF2267 family [Micromonospora rhizosphaerae]